jgi:hypothetical protein
MQNQDPYGLYTRILFSLDPYTRVNIISAHSTNRQKQQATPTRIRKIDPLQPLTHAYQVPENVRDANVLFDAPVDQLLDPSVDLPSDISPLVDPLTVQWPWRLHTRCIHLLTQPVVHEFSSLLNFHSGKVHWFRCMHECL